MSAARRRRLEEIVERIHYHWGAWLQLRISKEAPCTRMDWQTVELPAEELRPDPAVAEGRWLEIEADLWHEFAHRTLAPRSPAAYLVWQVVVASQGAADPGDLANLLADLAVDDQLAFSILATRPFYAACQERKVRAIRGLEAFRKPGVNEDPLIYPWRREFATRADVCRAAYHHLLGLARPGDVSEDVREAAARAVETLRSSRPLLEAVRVAARILGPYFRVPLRPRWTVSWSRPLAWTADQATDTELVQALVAAGLGPSLRRQDLDCVLGPERQLAVLAAVRERLYSGIVVAVDRMEAARRVVQLTTDGLGLWRPGDDLSQLDVPASLARAGPCPLIPGVNTFRRRLRQGAGIARSEAGAASVVLIVDDSGSMSGAPADRAAEAAVAVTRRAELHRDPVGLIVFASGVLAKVDPGYDYRGVCRTACRVDGGGGGTVIAPALEVAHGWFEARRHAFRRQTTIAITDAEVADWPAACEWMRALATAGRTALFLIGPFPSPAWMAEARGMGVHVYPVSPEKPIWLQAVREAET